MNYSVDQAALDVASDAVKAKFKNLMSVGMLKSIVAEVELKVKHFEAILRVMDFLQGMEAELRKDLAEAKVLVEKQAEAVVAGK